MSGNAFQVWSGFGQSVSILFFNRDVTNPVYLSYRPNVYIGATNAVILNPQSSVTMDGSRTIYAIGVNGAGPLQAIPGGSSYQPSSPPIASLAQLGSFGGTPAATLAAAASLVVFSLVNVLQYASYDLNAYGYAVTPGNAGSPICFLVTLQWFDDVASGIPVFEEDWWLWAGRAAPAGNTMAGCGPMHGQYMTVTVSLPSTSTTGLVLQYFNLFGSIRSLPYSDWRQNAILVNPQIGGLIITTAGAVGSAFDNTLASINNAAAAGSAIIFIPNGLYAGPVSFRYFASTTSLTTGLVAAVTGLVGGNLVAGTACPNIIPGSNFTGTATTTYTGNLILPRAPTLMIVQVAAAGATIDYDMIAQQAA
jgi:hypothetical protein